MRGGSSRAPRYQKHGFRLFFRSQYGQAKLDYDLFHGGGATEFKHFDLRCAQQYSWHHGFSPNALYVRDQFAGDAQLAMGQPGARGNFAHLYINGHYWGVFNTCERPEADFGESYLGGDADDFDVMKMGGGYSEDDGDRPRGFVPTDGNSDNWNKLHQLTSADLSDLANYTRVLGLNPDGTPDPHGQRLVDPVNLIDYMLVIFYVGHLDAPITWFGQNRGANNWYGLMNRERNEGFRFIVWDAEQALLRIGDDRLGPFPAGEHIRTSNPQWTYQRLLDNEEFRMLLADRVAKHLFRDGALTPGAATARFDKRINELRPGLFAEAARWGNPKKTVEWALNESSPNENRSSRENGVVKYDNWLKETERFKADYLTQRTDIVINQLKIRGLYPDLPEIEANWRDDQTLELAAAGSAIVFTTDGTDPRLFGGRLGDAARRYDAPVRVPAGTQLRCRIFDHGEWGPLRELSRPVGRSNTN